jgi:hypothetical protein
MANTYTRHLNLRVNEVGSVFPDHLINAWGPVINRELRIIDEAIGAFCTTDQIEGIKRAIKQCGKRGVLL